MAGMGGKLPLVVYPPLNGPAARPSSCACYRRVRLHDIAS